MAQLLQKLDAGVRRCRKCRLCLKREHAVPGEGPAEAAILLIGEAPGAVEDREGRPFVGRSGRFLDGLLAEAGLTREEVYITSAVKCRPPGNRTPKADELAICKAAWLDRQIELIRPGVIVLLGRTAVKQLMGKETDLGKMHGRFFECAGQRCFVSFHPAAGMRFPEVGRMIRSDFKKLKRIQ
jgi:uracil-DNA glycosylase